MKRRGPAGDISRRYGAPCRGSSRPDRSIHKLGSTGCGGGRDSDCDAGCYYYCDCVRACACSDRFSSWLACHRLPDSGGRPRRITVARFAARSAIQKPLDSTLCIQLACAESGGRSRIGRSNVRPRSNRGVKSLACASLSNVTKPDARSIGCFLDLNSAILDPALLTGLSGPPLASPCHQSCASGL